jgi:hypothetical protein
MMARISKNFTWEEFTASDTAKKLGILNHITDWDVRDNILALVENVLQPLRDAWGKPIRINSGYRCEKLNKAVGGEPASQHRKGEAADCGVDDTLALARTLLDLGLQFDQAIIYPTFVHISYKADGENRNRILYNKSYKGPKL